MKCTICGIEGNRAICPQCYSDCLKDNKCPFCKNWLNNYDDRAIITCKNSYCKFQLPQKSFLELGGKLVSFRKIK